MPHERPTRDVIAEGFLRQGTELSLIGRGRSMWPVITPGDRVVVRRHDRRPVPGDIVVLRTRSGLVTHRVVALLADPPRFVTRGDWLERNDAPVDETEVVGVVRRIVKRRITLDLETTRGAWAQRMLHGTARLLRRPRIRAAGRRLKGLLR